MATVHEAFSATFDPHPMVSTSAWPTTLGDTSAARVPGCSQPTSTSFAFGSTSARFHNTAFDSRVTHGVGNGTIIHLERAPPIQAQRLGNAAPSNQLPAYAASFSLEPGRAFGHTPAREAPATVDGTQQFWLQGKDVQPPLNIGPPPQLFTMAVPKGVDDTSGQLLMTPAERREMIVFQKSRERARQTLRASAHDACRRTLMLQRAYPNGVLGLESAATPGSLVYAHDHSRRSTKQATEQAFADARRENLALRRETPLEYALISHNSVDGFQSKIFPHKASVESAHLSSRQTYGACPANPSRNAYRSNQELPLAAPKEARKQQYVNVHTGGRDYDIISGCGLAIKPTVSRTEETRSDRRAHPSNLSMPQRGGTAPTLIGPEPASHRVTWKPASPAKSPSKRFLL